MKKAARNPLDLLVPFVAGVLVLGKELLGLARPIALAGGDRSVK